MRIRTAIVASAILSASRAICAADSPPATAGVYEDRVISASDLPPLQDEDAANADTAGPPRAIRVETGLADTRYGSTSRNEAAISTSGYWDTLSWGSWSIDGVLRSGDSNFGGSGNSLTLWQRRMPFADGWFADNGIGVVNTPALPLMRNGYRFALPITTIEGIETDWSSRGGPEIQAAIGEPGYFLGGHWSAFQSTGGQYGSASIQWPWSTQATGSIAVIDERNVLPWSSNSLLGPQNNTSRIDAQSVYAATAWEMAASRFQANLLVGKNGQGGSQVGGWLDASTDFDNYRQHYGVFRLDPDLTFGAQPFSNDLEGAYYRIDYQRAQWNWSAGLDEVRSISGNGLDGSYLTSALRYQMRPWVSLGGDATVKVGAGGAYSGSVYLDWLSRAGESRIQLQQARDSDGKQSDQLTLNHTLPTSEGTQFSVAVSFASIDSAYGGKTRSESLAMIGSYALGNSLSLDGNIRWTRGQGPEGQHGLDGNFSLNWRLNRNWSLAATYYQSEATQRSVFVIDPITQSTPFVSLPGTRAYSLLLRYEWHAGSPFAVLGASVGGVGSISGSVFLDANGNGRRDAGEAGAANVTVVVDGRYSSRTDASGRFEFQGVGAGEHTVSIIPDNLPLPWALEERASRMSVIVKPRGNAVLEIAAKRQ